MSRMMSTNGDESTCGACGAPVDEDGQYCPQDYDTDDVETSNDSDDDEADNRRKHLQVTQKRQADPSLSYSDALRQVHADREQRAHLAAEQVRTGVTPAQAERADTLQRVALRHMTESGCNFATGVRRALAENRAIARHYERGQ